MPSLRFGLANHPPLFLLIVKHHDKVMSDLYKEVQRIAFTRIALLRTHVMFYQYICEYIYECTSDPMFGLLLDRFWHSKTSLFDLPGPPFKIPELIGHTSLQKPRISTRIKRWRKFGEILQPFLEWANQGA